MKFDHKEYDKFIEKQNESLIEKIKEETMNDGKASNTSNIRTSFSDRNYKSPLSKYEKSMSIQQVTFFKYRFN
jgi:hypothetical protein